MSTVLKILFLLLILDKSTSLEITPNLSVYKIFNNSVTKHRTSWNFLFRLIGVRIFYCIKFGGYQTGGKVKDCVHFNMENSLKEVWRKKSFNPRKMLRFESNGTHFHFPTAIYGGISKDGIFFFVLFPQIWIKIDTW